MRSQSRRAGTLEGLSIDGCESLEDSSYPGHDIAPMMPLRAHDAVA